VKLGDLRFDTPDNACLSLRTLAEWVRTGEILVATASHVVASQSTQITVFEPKAKRK